MEKSENLKRIGQAVKIQQIKNQEGGSRNPLPPGADRVTFRDDFLDKRMEKIKIKLIIFKI